MQSMGNWDYAVIVKELQQYSGAYFDKFYICTDDSTLLRLRKGKAVSIVSNPTALYVTEKPPETLETPPQFVMIVRKWLENSTLKKVEQMNGDRIVAFNFSGKPGEFTLVFEQFAKGNCLLLDKDGVIVEALKREEYGARKLKPREKYIAPPARKNIDEISSADFKEKGKTVSALASSVNIPPFYIEEAVNRLKTPPDVIDASEEEKKNLVAELKKIKAEYAPMVYFENEKPVYFAFTELQKLAHLEKKNFENLSQALYFYYTNVEKTIEKKVDKGEGKISARLGFQQAAIEEYKSKAAESSAKADYINANYALFEELLATAAKMVKEKKSENEVEAKLIEIVKNSGEKIEIKIKDGKIEVEAP
ncbi:MAG: NFACT family protein [Candidatus Micrarchaeota archaeon]|nr:NFACT family protein [Candidatus Micrarchaeota archaeon]